MQNKRIFVLFVIIFVALATVGLLQLLPLAQAQTNPYGPAAQYSNSYSDSQAVSSLPFCNNHDVVTNCGFELGWTDWFSADASAPFFALTIDSAGVSPGFGFFTSAPTEGNSAVLNGFDADGPDVIEVAQDLTLPPVPTALFFDYRAAWDMFNFPGSSQPRLFQVDVEPVGGGTPMASEIVLTAPPATVITDTGNLIGVVDLGPFQSQTVRISFKWIIPESFTGPGFFQLDNIHIHVNKGILPGLYGTNNNSELFYIDTTTGAGYLIGHLPGSTATELEYDPVSGRAYAQSVNGVFSAWEIDLFTGQIIAGPIPNGAAFNGLEFVEGTAFGASILGSMGPSTFGTIDLGVGAFTPIGPTGVGPISGLAYDEANEIMYGVAGGVGGGTSDLYTVNMSTGMATVISNTLIRAGSLEFGSGNVLYAGGGQADAGLWIIDPATGASTFVGDTGFGTVTGLAYVGLEVYIPIVSKEP